MVDHLRLVAGVARHDLRARRLRIPRALLRRRHPSPLINHQTSDVVGRDQFDLWARGLDRFTADRAHRDPAQFFDVGYRDLVNDPIGTVRAIYAHFGLALTEPAVAAMTAIHADNTAGPRQPAHRYQLSDFGLTGEEVDERFADYLRAHGRD